ncbi:hypothetical protein H5410_064608 [Solanum commersonii]|uniref:Uncharacterized protein n=1 Tax=Solanum commersonii TaxID=4109 RepID=A0A9J5VZK2_SOLCO|nr:hypothetical protein H5410_064608 [Solanum commersonii]
MATYLAYFGLFKTNLNRSVPGILILEFRVLKSRLGEDADGASWTLSEDDRHLLGWNACGRWGRGSLGPTEMRKLTRALNNKHWD